MSSLSRSSSSLFLSPVRPSYASRRSCTVSSCSSRPSPSPSSSHLSSPVFCDVLACAPSVQSASVSCLVRSESCIASPLGPADPTDPVSVVCPHPKIDSVGSVSGRDGVIPGREGCCFGSPRSRFRSQSQSFRFRSRLLGSSRHAGPTLASPNRPRLVSPSRLSCLSRTRIKNPTRFAAMAR